MSEKLFPIPFALWLIVTVAWFVGADGFAIRSTSGQVVNLDFNRKYDHAARLLAPGLSLSDDADGDVMRIKPAWIPYCWLCGTHLHDGLVMQGATFRRGPWVYRTPKPDPNFEGWTNARGIAAALVLAYDLDTGEVLSATRGSSVEERRVQLESKGLFLDDASLLDRSKLPPVSMLSEGCAIFQSAFFIVLPLWSLGFGVVWLVKRRRKP